MSGSEIGTREPADAVPELVHARVLPSRPQPHTPSEGSSADVAMPASPAVTRGATRVESLAPLDFAAAVRRAGSGDQAHDQEVA